MDAYGKLLRLDWPRTPARKADFHPKLPCHPVCRSRSAMPPGARRDAASSTPRAAARPSGRIALRPQRSPMWDGLLVAICRRGETAEHGDDLDHDRRTPSLRRALAPLTVRLTGALFCFSLTGSAGGKMLSYIARASRIRRARSRSDFGTNRIISPIFAPNIG